MSKLMKRIGIAMLWIIGILIVTNPSHRDMKEHIGFIDGKHEVRRIYNYLILSGYKVTEHRSLHGNIDRRYLGIFGNFIELKP